ncbi:MAG: pirin family protein [Phycisphaerales bacterium JB043]
MITIRHSTERGHFDLGWLDTYHTFSFGHFRDPDWKGFSHLRVLNQDRVAPGKGFGTHGHDNMEIVSVVLEGTLEHKDSMGNGSQMTPGDIQLMSAGTGVTHSEFNASGSEPLHFLQMWIIPAQHDTEPRYQQHHFSEEERRNTLRLVVSPDGADGSLTIGQDARLYVSSLASGATLEHPLANARAAWLHVTAGAVTLNGMELREGDGASITDTSTIKLDAADSAAVVLWELPVP